MNSYCRTLTLIMAVLAMASLATAQSKFGLDKRTLTEGIEAPTPEQLGEVRPELAEGEAIVDSAGFLEFDQENNIVYGRERSKVYFNRFTMEADRMLVDLRSNEIQASGNVILTAVDEVYQADSARYNYKTFQGVAFHATGQRGNFFFRANPRHEEKTGEPGFQRLDENESLFRHASYTSCDFPIPHYKVVASELSFFIDDRVFVKNAVIYVRGIPVMWVPAYTFSMIEASPWAWKVGYDSDLGGILALSYDWHHWTQVPQIDGSREYRDRGSASLRGEWYTSRGYGAGLTYKYSFDYGKHRGILDLWALKDTERDFEDEIDDLYQIQKDNLFSDTVDNIFFNDDVGDDDEDPYRWRALWLHRSQLSDTLYAQINIDTFRDPEVFRDFLDLWSEQERGRYHERRGRFALTDRHDNWFWRVLVDIKERIGRDRLNNFHEPGDDDADFNIDPDNLLIRQAQEEAMETGETVDVDVDEDDPEWGISPDRWGRVSKRYPQVTVGTPYIPAWRRNMYYQIQLDVLRNLDKGLNTIDTDDDSYVIGADLYQSMSYLWRISRDVTLLSKIGVGVARYDREEDSYDYKFPEGAFDPPSDPNAPHLPFFYPGVNWVDDETFLVGERILFNPETDQLEVVGGREVSILDVDENYAYFDIEERLNVRFTDTLDGYLRWFFRDGTEDSLGEFYESIGNTLAREDIYDFRNPQHWLEARLNYRLLYPNVGFSIFGRENLQSGDDIHSKEIIREAGFATNYISPRGRLALDAGINYYEDQLRDRSDEFEYHGRSLFAFGGATYTPLSGMWFASVFVNWYKPLEDDPIDDYFEDLERQLAEEQGLPFDSSRFNENEDQTDIRATIGGKLGPKYYLEVSAEYQIGNDDDDRFDEFGDNNNFNDEEEDGLQEVTILLSRDFHDAIVTIELSIETRYEDDVTVTENEDGTTTVDRDTDKEYEFQFEFTYEFKMPSSRTSYGASTIRRSRDYQKQVALEEYY